MATQMTTNSLPIPAVDWRVYILHTASMIGGGDSLPTQNSDELMQLPSGTDRRGLCTVDLAAGYLTRFLPIEFAQFRSQLYLLWSPYVIGQTIIFSCCDLFFFPRLISAVGDCMSTILPHMVWP